MVVSLDEEESSERNCWKLYFDGASNGLGHSIGAVLITLEGEYCLFTARLDLTTPITWQNIKLAPWDYRLQLIKG